MRTLDSRIYVGRLAGGEPAVYAVGSAAVERLRPATGALRWGAGADSAELARVLLADATGAEPPADACERFAQQILARLPHDGFALQRDTVDAWLRRFVTV
jgi:hypothetical protein